MTEMRYEVKYDVLGGEQDLHDQTVVIMADNDEDALFRAGARIGRINHEAWSAAHITAVRTEAEAYEGYSIGETAQRVVEAVNRLGYGASMTVERRK